MFARQLVRLKQNEQNTKYGRRQSVQQKNGKRVTREERSFVDVVSQGKMGNQGIPGGFNHWESRQNRKQKRGHHSMYHGQRTNDAEKEATSAKYRRLVKTHKEARIGEIVLSGILPVMGDNDR